MLRDENLVPLSHQHQHALALCVRLDRALQADTFEPEQWQDEIAHHFNHEISIHFTAEEKHLFPIAAGFRKLETLTQELISEHASLRKLFDRAVNRELDRDGLQSLVSQLAHHIRKEERQLFEAMQKMMNGEELAQIGAALDRALSEASTQCLAPNPATKLKGKS